MATNYVQKGDVLTFPAPATVASGEVVVAGALIGVAAGDAASGAPVDLETRGVWRLPKVSADTIDLGQIVYFDATAKLVTEDSASGANPRLGVAVAAAGNGVGFVNVKLG
jgi:predicted RecA/RadA family phage recombinase